MDCKKLIISKHALNRTIERMIKCQNIKLNKKQVKKNTKAAYKLIENELKNSFAYSYNMYDECTYYYSKLDKNGKCNKYVVSDENVVITVIINIDLSEEVKKVKLIYKKKIIKIEEMRRYKISDYIYTLIDGMRFLFVVSIDDNSIFSFQSLKGC